MRIVEGLRGRVPMRMELAPALRLRGDQAVDRAGVGRRRSQPRVPTRSGSARRCRCRCEDGTVSAEFVAVEGARERLTLTWHLSYEETPPVEDADSALARTEAWWREWSGRCTLRGCVSRRGPDLADRAQGDDLGDDRSGDRGADDLAAGGDRRRAQLGLPLLLAARLGACAGGAACRRATRTRRWRSATSCCESAPATRRRSRSCTGSAANSILRQGEVKLPDWLPGYEGSRTRARLATPRSTSSSSTSTASSTATLYDGIRECRDGRSADDPAEGDNETRRDRRLAKVADQGPRDLGVARTGSGYLHVVESVGVGGHQRLGSCHSKNRSSKRRQKVLGRGSDRRWRFDGICSEGYDPKRNTFTQYYGSSGLDGSLLALPARRVSPGYGPSHRRNHRSRRARADAVKASCSARRHQQDQ